MSDCQTMLKLRPPRKDQTPKWRRGTNTKKKEENSTPTKNNTNQHQPQIAVFTRAGNNQDIEKVEPEKLEKAKKSEAEPEIQIDEMKSKAETLKNKKAKPLKKPLTSETFNLKKLLELKRMEKENKIGTLPPTHPSVKPISVANNNTSNYYTNGRLWDEAITHR